MVPPIETIPPVATSSNGDVPMVYNNASIVLVGVCNELILFVTPHHSDCIFRLSLNMMVLYCHVPFFICSCYHYSDLCLTSTYFITSTFCLPSSISYLSSDLPNPLPFHLPSSVSHLYFDFSLLISIFHLLSYVPLFCFYYYLSTICPLFLAFPFRP